MPSTTSTPLPTAEQLDASRGALNENYNRLEEIEMLLRAAHAAALKGTFDGTIDDALIGRLYRYLNDADIEIEQATQTAADIRNLVYQLDAHGRDSEFQARRQEATINA